MSTKPILQIAIPSPLHHTFDYLPPDHIPISSIMPGMRVEVSFGRNNAIGVVTAVAHESSIDPARLKRVQKVLDRTPVLPAEIMQLCQWASHYYHYPLGEILSVALPAALRKGKATEARGTRIWKLTSTGMQLTPAQLKRAPRQAALLNLLLQHPEGIEKEQLEQLPGDWQGTLRTMSQKGWVESSEQAGPQPAMPAPDQTKSLNDAQQQAVDAVCAALGTFQPSLLYGVTGSGKTEVYLQIIEQVLARGEQALILVPEIGLTPQLAKRFRRRFSVPLAIFHSGLSEQERLNAWLAARDGSAPIVIGTRSAVFAPLKAMGIIIVDEEHDTSLKQQDGFRYSARDLAMMRARTAGIPILLGSATPSLESLHNAQSGRYLQYTLPERAGSAIHPRMRLLDVRNQLMDEGLAQGLIEQIREHLGRDGQVLLFLNRRGYAPTLLCHQCGWVAECQRCDSHMTLHQNSQRLRCHHCMAERRLDSSCPKCGSVDLRAVGQGTERTEQALQQCFPDTSIVRIDRDSTRRKGSMEHMLEQAHKGHSRILIGTQLLAKGHHFPQVTLVGIIDADHGLFGSDFRAGERMAQLVLQVAGRAGRAEKPGEVVIQTHHPEHPLMQLLLSQDYARIAQTLLDERRVTSLPPYTYLALLRAESPNQEAPYQFLSEAMELAQQFNPRSPQGQPEVELLGPVPAPMERRAGRYRAQLLLQSSERAALHRLLTPWIEALEQLKMARKVRWSLDVDPMEMF